MEIIISEQHHFLCKCVALWFDIIRIRISIINKTGLPFFLLQVVLCRGIHVILDLTHVLLTWIAKWQHILLLNQLINDSSALINFDHIVYQSLLVSDGLTNLCDRDTIITTVLLAFEFLDGHLLIILLILVLKVGVDILI